jgi:hypothetical protein
MIMELTLAKFQWFPAALILTWSPAAEDLKTNRPGNVIYYSWE